MSLNGEFEAIMKKARSSISFAMLEGADVGAYTIEDTIFNNVYDAYEPSSFWKSRRRGNMGGLADMRLLEKTVDDDLTLEIRSLAPARNDFGVKLGADLDYAVTTGYAQGNAGPRSFYEDAEKALFNSGIIQDYIDLAINTGLS